MCYESLKVVRDFIDVLRVASQLIVFVFHLKHAFKVVKNNSVYLGLIRIMPLNGRWLQANDNTIRHQYIILL